MFNLDRHPIRLCEWASRPAAELTARQREDIYGVVKEWCRSAGIPDSPLMFHGPDGTTISASHYVGVVEVGDVCIEIFPKLDRALLGMDALPSDKQAGTVMSNLLWMMESCRFMDLTEADTAHLSTAPVTYYDVFAYLMAKSLRYELEAGIAHFYVPVEDDLRAIRGQMNILDQITRNWNRVDRIACKWDEFTADIPLNRLFKCACRMLQTSVSHPAAVRVLDSCCELLDEVTDVAPRVALNEISVAPWHRANDRFRDCFDMAVRLLAGTGYEMGMGADKSFVFLIDMNSLFESFVGAVLETNFGAAVTLQPTIGHLFTDPRCISQRADYFWHSDGLSWVGDAKYKLLAGEDKAGALAKFRDLPPDDVRQLTVYAEIRRKPGGISPSIALLYPLVGDSVPSASLAMSWNGSPFWLVPVRVTRPSEDLTDIRSAMPKLGMNDSSLGRC